MVLHDRLAFHLRFRNLLLGLLFAVAAHATTLTWIPGSTAKVEQMIGDCDYTAQAQTGQCAPTTSQSVLKSPRG